jgi:hypothetical protein
MTFEERAYAVLFENADETLLTEGEIYELYDTVTELIEEKHGEVAEDYHFSSSSLPHKEKVLQ